MINKMLAALYIGKEGFEDDVRIKELAASLEKGGCSCYYVFDGGSLREGTDLVLSVGGDGTFLSVAMLVADLGVPVVGVNLGRLGFLSENHPEDVAQAILSQDYTIEERSLLKASLSAPCGNPSIDGWPYALNEVAVHRSGAAMLGVDVCLDGKWLPTYWADGLIVSTSSGSTAYSLSVGGPIVLPQSKVLILAPIAPHNLNIRPLVIPDSSEVHLRVHSRDGKAIFTIDNRTVELPEGLEITVSLAHFSLRRVRFNNSDFINALTEKLFWGEDVRNIR
jgi:NAD+ kinase